MKITRPSSFNSHRTLRHGVITALSTLAIGAAMSLSSVNAQIIYVGGDAADGLNVASGGTYGASIATIVDIGTSQSYTAASSETVTVNQVNFQSNGSSGTVTPFLAYY